MMSNGHCNDSADRRRHSVVSSDQEQPYQRLVVMNESKKVVDDHFVHLTL